MTGGFTPFDKNSYKASKRRRKQALIEEKTGKIMPVSNPKNKLIVIICLSVVFIAAAIWCIAAFSFHNEMPSDTSSADIQKESELLLTVVNTANPLDRDFVPELDKVLGFSVNKDASSSLKELLKAAEKNGTPLKIKAAYVSFDEQENKFNSEYERLMKSSSYTSVRAEAAVLRTTPHGGCSEAQTGLLVDFSLDNSQAKSYLERVCVSYGFVQRYPENKTSQTNMAASDSLYRYVGKDNAKRMRSYGMCLEEYCDYLAQQQISE